MTMNLTMKELKWELAPEKPGDNDSNSSRIRRWEEANPGVKLKDLPEQQAVEALAWILMLTEQEAEDYMTWLRSQP